MLTNMLNDDGTNRLVKMRHGWMLYNRHDKFVGASIEHYGEFSHLEMVLFEQLIKPGNIIIEVGANIGAHTLGLAKLVTETGAVFAYEAQPVVFQILCANMALNQSVNVQVFNKAVSNQKTIMRIPNINYDKPGNFGGVDIRQFTSGNIIEVVILDEALEHLPRVHFIKIDVEGMELAVLDGCQQLITKHRPILYVENDRLETSTELIEFIQKLDYRLFWHTPPLYNPNNFCNNQHNLFGRIASFNMLCLHNRLNINLNGFTEIKDSSDHPLKELKKKN